MTNLEYLKTLDLESVVSPTQFSLSVLNATPASIAIATHNQSEISAVSATPSLEYGFINADSTEETLLIAYEEYLNKVKEIIGKICKVLKEKNKKLDDYFIKALSKSVNDFKAIQLINLVDILKNDFNIDLTHLSIIREEEKNNN